MIATACPMIFTVRYNTKQNCYYIDEASIKLLTVNQRTHNHQ